MKVLIDDDVVELDASLYHDSNSTVYGSSDGSIIVQTGSGYVGYVFDPRNGEWSELTVTANV